MKTDISQDYGAERPAHADEGQPLALSGAGRPVVTLHGHVVTITGLVVEDRHLAEQVGAAEAAGEDAAKRVRLLLEAGARLANLGGNELMLRQIQEAVAGATGELGQEREAFASMLTTARSEFERSLTDAFQRQLGHEEDDGAIARAFAAMTDKFFAQLTTETQDFKAEFDEGRNDNLMAKLTSAFTASWQGAIRELRSQLTTPGPENPLHAVLRGQNERIDAVVGAIETLDKTVSQRMLEIAERVAKEEGRADERQRGTAKGRDFEQVVFDELWTLASPHGDVVIDVTDVSATNGKTGDYVVSVLSEAAPGGEVRVVWEAKNRQNGMSMNAAIKELSAAMANRDAGIGVIVFAHPDQMPGRDGPLLLLGGNMVACSYDVESRDNTVLKVAYRLARALALSRARPDPADVAAAMAATEKINEALKVITQQRKHLDEVKRHADGAIQCGSQAETELSEAITKLTDALSSAGEGRDL